MCFITAMCPRIFKHVIRQYNTTEWHGPLYPQFGRSTNRTHSFNTCSHSAKQSVNYLSDAGFFHTGKHFQHRKTLSTQETVFYRYREIPQNKRLM